LLRLLVQVGDEVDDELLKLFSPDNKDVGTTALPKHRYQGLRHGHLTGKQIS